MRATTSSLFKAAFAFVLAAGSVTSSHAIDLGSRVSETPYDRFMTPVKNVITNLDGSAITFQEVTTLMRQARAFRYSFSTNYVAATPEQTASRRAGDCKDKSLWLADAMEDQNVRFVIGKLSANSRINHAWLYWNHKGEWFVLDPTHHARPLAVKSLRRNQYVPFYSYTKNATYTHGAVMPMHVAVASNDAVTVKVAEVKRASKAGKVAAKNKAANKVARVKKSESPIAEAPVETAKVKKADSKKQDFASRLKKMEGRG